MIGNSSSGIIEMPSFKKPSINIGSRQEGRVASKSVVNVNHNKKEILKKINYAISKILIKKLGNLKILIINHLHQKNCKDYKKYKFRQNINKKIYGCLNENNRNRLSHFLKINHRILDEKKN